MIVYKKDNFKFYNKQNNDLPDNHVWCIKTDEEKVWVGTKRGLVKITGSDWKIYNKKNSIIPSNIITKITKDEYHRIWIGTTKGFVSYNGFDWKRYCKQKKINTIFNIYIIK